MWKPAGLLLFVAPVWDDEVLCHRDKHADWGTATEKKRYRRAAREAPISSCKVRTINPALQIVAEGDLVRTAVSLLSKTKDEWSYRGYYGLSTFSITIGAGWIW